MSQRFRNGTQSGNTVEAESILLNQKIIILKAECYLRNKTDIAYLLYSLDDKYGSLQVQSLRWNIQCLTLWAIASDCSTTQPELPADTLILTGSG